MDIPAEFYWAIGVIAALQIWILLVVFRTSGRVESLRRHLDGAEEAPRRSRSRRSGHAETPRGADIQAENSRYDGSRREQEIENETLAEDRSGSEQGRLFAEFLNEDPARMELSKKEQFEAFRRWRSQKGLNWRGS